MKNVQKEIVVVSNSILRQLNLPLSCLNYKVLPKAQSREELMRQIIQISREAILNPDKTYEITEGMLYVYDGNKKVGGPYMSMWDSVTTPTNVCFKRIRDDLPQIGLEFEPDRQLKLALQF